MIPTIAASGSSEGSPLSSVPPSDDEAVIDKGMSKEPTPVHEALLDTKAHSSKSPSQDRTHSPGVPKTIRLKLKMPEEKPIFKSTASLSKVDLFKLLSDETALDSLTHEQLHRLLSLLPRDSEAIHQDTIAGRISAIKAVLHDNDAFKADVQQLQRDAQGRFTQLKARAAARSRAEGAFDDWKEEHLEVFWGQKARPE
ncbi:hypothetical protein H2199_005251 [Coniosporium tulheliwenetii]|uniref:Uncharacterized protein n=1 Tax=Coniosporium tulheliwenetii TaxID=3383036 RepID=A0ACC2Z2Z1_9PEZI|nr:hypothetical protein H2199_005251 [Cladosporium sp. JES 115]